MQDTPSDGGTAIEPGAANPDQSITAPSDAPDSKAFARLRRERDEAARALKELRQAEEDRKREAAEKRGEFETLYQTAQTELDTMRQELDGLREYKTAAEERAEKRRAQRIERLGEDWAGLIPDGLPGDKLDVLIDRLEDRKRSQAGASTPAEPAPIIPGGSGTGGDGRQPDLIKPAQRAWMESNRADWLGSPPHVQLMLLRKFAPEHLKPGA